MNEINLTQDALNKLRRCLPNIKVFVTLKGWRPSTSNQLQDNNSISSLSFTEYKELKKCVIDINHLHPMTTSLVKFLFNLFMVKRVMLVEKITNLL